MKPKEFDLRSFPGEGTRTFDAGLAAIAAGLAWLLWVVGWTAPLDRSASDTLLRLTHRSTPSPPVAVVVIDDDSVAALGPLPWPRSLVADLVASGHRSGAAGVALDILLADPGDPSHDASLSKALDRGPSLLAAALEPDGRWMLPDHRFGGAQRAAHVHAEIGPDGVVRTILETKQADGLALPALSLAAARILSPDIAISPGAAMAPDFRPAPDRLDPVPAVDLILSSDPDPRLSGRLVFIGVTATGSGDRLIVPTNPGPAPSPGVLVHASAAASILRGGLVHHPAVGWTVFGLFLAAFAPQVLRTRTGLFRFAAVALMAVAVVVFAGLALEFRHLLIPVPTLLVGMGLSVALREGVESSIARRETGRLLQSLLRHHDPDHSSEIPKSAAAKLSTLRGLQAAVLRQDAARQTLLEGMHDGVVMWDANGRTAVVNSAARRLWGDEPRKRDFDSIEGAPDGADTAIVERRGRVISVARLSIAKGGLALLRDVTAERELDRKRREMQRLVSHELKTPLASIAGFGETLQRYELDPDEQRRVAALIRNESTRLGEMVATFLDLERLGSSHSTDATESIDLGSLVEQRLEVLSQSARQRGQKIVAEIKAGVSVQSSPDHLARVVDNLVGNALKYSSDEGVIRVSVARDGTNAVLVVTDHGIGIPEDALPRIFERFFRAPGTEGPGSGLGLAVAHEFVTWHGGCIDVESIVGQGSAFTVRLPMEA